MSGVRNPGSLAARSTYYVICSVGVYFAAGLAYLSLLLVGHCEKFTDRIRVPPRRDLTKYPVIDDLR